MNDSTYGSVCIFLIEDVGKSACQIALSAFRFRSFFFQGAAVTGGDRFRAIRNTNPLVRVTSLKPAVGALDKREGVRCTLCSMENR